MIGAACDLTITDTRADRQAKKEQFVPRTMNAERPTARRAEFSHQI
jgi:hypothetical protein